MDITIPKGEFDNQLFIDAYGVEWRFNIEDDCWYKKGKIDSIPVANGVNTGLLSKQLKYMLDKIPSKGGGYAIITKPFLKQRTQNNPDGVLYGDIELVSNSLDIKCVHADGREISDSCLRVSYKETDTIPPGFDINFSDLLLENLCVIIPGGPGLPGEDGQPGEDGKDGTGDGPIGLTGQSGEDATEKIDISGIKIVDLDGISNIAITKLELDAQSGKLFVTKGQVKTQNNNDAIANRLIVSQINRGIRFLGNCFDYELVHLPCRPDDDYDVLDPMIAYLPSTFDQNDIRAIQPVKRNLSELVNNLISFYQNKINEVADGYDEQIEKFIKEKDSEARKILDELGDRLAECENITYLDYCIGLGAKCVDDGTDGDSTVIDIPATKPDCQIIAETLGVKNGSCQVLATKTIVANTAPVFSWEAPKKFALPKVGSKDAGFDIIHEDLTKRLQRGMYMFKKQQILYNKTQAEFPAGTYAFLYDSGAFKQDRMTKGELVYVSPFIAYLWLQPFTLTDNISVLLSGAFNEYFVGSEGVSSQVPIYAINPVHPEMRLPISNVVSTSVGLEIGFVPSSKFKGLLKDTYFDKYKYNPTVETGKDVLYKMNPRVDYVGVGNDIRQDESFISWKGFQAISGSHSDQATLQKAYLNGSVKDRMVGFTTTEPGLFFARVKLAMSPLSFYGTFGIGLSAKNGLTFLQDNLDVALFAMVNARKLTRVPPATEDTFQVSPTLNAKPVGTGEVKIQVMKINKPETSVSTTNTTA